MSRSRDLANLAGDATGLETLTVSDITDLTATATELNKLDGVTATTTELNYVDGVGSALQTQIDAKLGSSDTFNGTIGSSATFPADSICYARTYVGTGSDYTVNTGFGATSLTNNNKYYTDNYFTYTPKYSNSLLLISAGMASKFGRSTSSDCGISFFVGVTPSGGSESFPNTLTEYIGTGNSHSVMYYSVFISADIQWYHTFNGSYTVSNTNAYTFKIHIAPYNCTKINFNNYSSHSQVHLFEVKQ